jgi:putative endonuclease
VTNVKWGSLYIGITRNLEHRVWEHKNKTLEGFTKKYNCSRLVYYEEYSLAVEAISREKNLKKWKRNWKIKLIERANPEWRDLSFEWF